MTSVARDILQQALGLDPIERAELIDELLSSFDPVPDSRIDEAWSAEAESRIDAHGRGGLWSSPADQVFERLSRR
jgi:putative addiction module component (TIGR02574 family)